MRIDKKKLKLEEDRVDVSKLVADISRGRSILFTGAGFSLGSTSIGGGGPLTAPELSERISKLAKIPPNKNLMFSSDYYLKNNSSTDLIKTLVNNYTLKDVSDSQVSICKLHWRRFYTTNYDKSIEIASGKSNKLVETVDLGFSTKEYYKRDGLCIHLNGSIDILTEASLDREFKLTQSSYVSPDSFLGSDWFYYFKRDLERASSIVFVGYSLYDIDIQKVLFEDLGLKEKTYFITKPDPDIELNFTLSKFGSVVPIGVEGFAEMIVDYGPIEDLNVAYSLQSLRQYDISEKIVNVRDENVERMLMYGDVSDEIIDDSLLNKQKVPILVVRDCLIKVNKIVASGGNVRVNVTTLRLAPRSRLNRLSLFARCLRNTMLCITSAPVEAKATIEPKCPPAAKKRGTAPFHLATPPWLEHAPRLPIDGDFQPLLHPTGPIISFDMTRAC